jgi:hypothetical protein
VSALAWEQGYPSRPVRIIIPFPAGQATDTIAQCDSGGHSSLRIERAPRQYRHRSHRVIAFIALAARVYGQRRACQPQRLF